ncbi:MAG: molybdenum cofactor guanylyltransferase [Deltaproteobacteria bacterium]|nr:molybdenum cofactor guanylyltransferase [Deltaproteobacteria bacterium]
MGGLAKGLLRLVAEGDEHGVADGVADSVADGTADGIADGTADGTADGVGEPIVVRTARTVRRVFGADAEIVLVGRDVDHGDAYARLGFVEIADEPAGIGPMGGLRGACLFAEKQGHPWVLLLGCDMPFVSASLLEALSRARGEGEDVSAVTPRANGRLQPLCAFYRTSSGLQVTERQIAAGRFGLTEGVLALRPRIVDVAPDDVRSLRDWDTPDDVLQDAGAWPALHGEPARGAKEE